MTDRRRYVKICIHHWLNVWQSSKGAYSAHVKVKCIRCGTSREFHFPWRLRKPQKGQPGYQPPLK